MKRILIGAPGLLAAGFSPKTEAWKTIIERSRIFGIGESEPGMTELSWLGLPPKYADIAQGPLAAAAFRIAPPDRSVIYQATLMGLNDKEEIHEVSPSEEEARDLFSRLSSLNRRNWTFVEGSSATHLLVHEHGSIDNKIPTPLELYRSKWEPQMPQGEDEDVLIGFIRDSRDVLESSEFNRRRRGEGLPEIAFVWPWGQGLTASLPNLAVSRGELIRYESPCLRVKGATQMAGYWHGSLTIETAQRLRNAQSHREPTVILYPINNEEDSGQFAHEVEEYIFNPLILKKSSGDLRLTIIDSAPSGLGLNFDSRRMATNFVPYDLHVLDDPRVKQYPLHDAVMRSLAE